MVSQIPWQCPGRVGIFIHKQVSAVALANTIITLNYQESLQPLVTSAVCLGEQKYSPSTPRFPWH